MPSRRAAPRPPSRSRTGAPGGAGAASPAAALCTRPGGRRGRVSRRRGAARLGRGEGREPGREKEFGGRLSPPPDKGAALTRGPATERTVLIRRQPRAPRGVRAAARSRGPARRRGCAAAAEATRGGVGEEGGRPPRTAPTALAARAGGRAPIGRRRSQSMPSLGDRRCSGREGEAGGAHTSDAGQMSAALRPAPGRQLLPAPRAPLRTGPRPRAGTPSPARAARSAAPRLGPAAGSRRRARQLPAKLRRGPAGGGGGRGSPGGGRPQRGPSMAAAQTFI